MSGFNSVSNRLLQATYDDYLDVLKKFLNFIESTEIIKNFIDDCGGFNAEIREDLNTVINNHDKKFKFSVDDKLETSEVYSVVKLLCEGELLPYGLLFSYSRAKNIDDKLYVFNHRVIFILINHINDYLKKVGIDMGMDDNVTYNINNAGQVNIANDDSAINAVQNNNGINADELKKLITAMRENLDSNLSADDKAEAIECIDVIEAELSSAQPNETSVKDKFKLLKRIDSSVKFASACCSLLTFADKMHPFINQIIPWFRGLV